MKYIILVFTAFVLSASLAEATCVGGFDGNEKNYFGCSELGGMGDLLYERDINGNVVKKRSDAEIKDYIVSVIDNRLSVRGISVYDENNGTSHIEINQDTVTFNIYNDNKEKVYTYIVDKRSGVPQNEEELIGARNQIKQERAAKKTETVTRMQRLKDLLQTIQVEEIEKSGKAKK